MELAQNHLILIEHIVSMSSSGGYVLQAACYWVHAQRLTITLSSMVANNELLLSKLQHPYYTK